MTSKQRSNLRSIASGLDPIMQIGKGGMTDTVIKQAADHLFHKELIKITVLQNSATPAKELADDLAKKLDAELVAAIGSKVILYKFSTKEGIVHITF